MFQLFVCDADLSDRLVHYFFRAHFQKEEFAHSSRGVEMLVGSRLLLELTEWLSGTRLPVGS